MTKENTPWLPPSPCSVSLDEEIRRWENIRDRLYRAFVEGFTTKEEMRPRQDELHEVNEYLWKLMDARTTTASIDSRTLVLSPPKLALREDWVFQYLCSPLKPAVLIGPPPRPPNLPDTGWDMNWPDGKSRVRVWTCFESAAAFWSAPGWLIAWIFTLGKQGRLLWEWELEDGSEHS